MLRIVSVSGGKDSTALYLWAIEQWGKEGFRAVFADTGNEHPVTYNYVRNMHTMCNGPVVEWVKADFSRRLEAKGTKPQNSSRRPSVSNVSRRCERHPLMHEYMGSV